ncbi:hypothetical protein ACU5AY_11115 [Rhizobium sp. PAMB 3174]
MARQPDDTRLDKQRERQRELRRKQKQEKRPSRDDVARIALFWLVRGAIEKNQLKELEKFRDRMVMMLVEQGFDEKACDEVLDDLFRKYRSGGSPFRRKAHLLFSDDGDDLG